MEDPIKNKVKESGLININLEDFYPRGERVLFDIGTLFSEEGILREKEFRARIQDVDWTDYLRDSWDEHGRCFINNYLQTKPVHYHVKKWLTDEHIERLEGLAQ